MPELPEVELYRRFVDQTTLGMTVQRIEVDDTRLLRCSEDELDAAITGATFTETERVGKFLFLKTNRSVVLMLHFGMRGSPGFFPTGEPPRFAHVRFVGTDGFTFALVDPRKFGRIDLANSVSSYRTKRKLGPDARSIEREEFVEALSGRKAVVKSALLQQHKFAGIGNWIADEMLFHLNIHPATRLDQLSRSDLEALYDQMQHILSLAIEHDADYASFPPGYLVTHRWGDGKCPRTGEPLIKLKVGGRATYISPALNEKLA